MNEWIASRPAGRPDNAIVYHLRSENSTMGPPTAMESRVRHPMLGYVMSGTTMNISIKQKQWLIKQLIKGRMINKKNKMKPLHVQSAYKRRRLRKMHTHIY